MKAGFFGTVRDAMLRPSAFFSKPRDERSSWSPVVFGVVLWVFAEAVTASFLMALGGRPSLMRLATSPLRALLVLLAVCALIHALLLAFGRAPRPFRETLACFGYAQAPLVLSLLPGIGLPIGLVYSFVVLVMALNRVHGSTTWRSMAAILLGTCVPVVFAAVLRVGLFDAFTIPSASMTPTLQVGDRIFVNKFVYGLPVPRIPGRFEPESLPHANPAPGEIVAFRSAEEPENVLFGRIVATSEDTLELQDGRPIVNGTLAPNCHLGRYATPHGSEAELFVEFLGKIAYLTVYERLPDATACEEDKACTSPATCRDGRCSVLEGPFRAEPGEVLVMGDNRDSAKDASRYKGGKGGGVAKSDIVGRAINVWMSLAEGSRIARDRLFLDLHGRPIITGTQDLGLREKLATCLEKGPEAKEPTPPPSASP